MDPFASEAFRVLLIIAALFMVLLLATISAYPLVDWIGRHPHQPRKADRPAFRGQVRGLFRRHQAEPASSSAIDEWRRAA
jgi:hypothetical protein